jgi:hypothetical protein
MLTVSRCKQIVESPQQDHVRSSAQLSSIPKLTAACVAAISKDNILHAIAGPNIHVFASHSTIKDKPYCWLVLLVVSGGDSRIAASAACRSGTLTTNDSLDLLAEFMGCGESVAAVTNKVL